MSTLVNYRIHLHISCRFICIQLFQLRYNINKCLIIVVVVVVVVLVVVVVVVVAVVVAGTVLHTDFLPNRGV